MKQFIYKQQNICCNRITVLVWCNKYWNDCACGKAVIDELSQFYFNSITCYNLFCIKHIQISLVLRVKTGAFKVKFFYSWPCTVLSTFCITVYKKSVYLPQKFCDAVLSN